MRSISNNYHLRHRLYSDDSQIYISLSTPDANNCSLQQLRTCLDDVFHWMNESRLTLNADKIEFIIIGANKECFPCSLP